MIFNLYYWDKNSTVMIGEKVYSPTELIQRYGTDELFLEVSDNRVLNVFSVDSIRKSLKLDDRASTEEIRIKWRNKLNEYY